MIQIPLTPDLFGKVATSLPNLPGITKFSPASPTTGSVQTKQLDFNYSYDGWAMLTITPTAKHSLKAKLASDAQIQEYFEHLLAPV